MKKLPYLLLLCLGSCDVPAIAAQPASYPLFVGAAVREITPRQEWLPLFGVARTKLVGIIDPVHVRVIAVGNGSKPALIVTFEAGGPPAAKPFLTGLAEHTGVPVGAVYFGGTHGHTTPSFDEDPQVPSSKLYTNFVRSQMLAAADAAIASMRPATIDIGTGRSYINTNRQGVYRSEDGTSVGAQGYNPSGPSDKTLTVVRFADRTGKPIAFIVHYAVHNTVMYANHLNDAGTGVSGDIAAAVSGHLEKKFPGAVANWIPGAAGNQNPIISNEYFTPDPDTGKQEVQVMKRATVELLEFYGKTQFADVQAVLASMKPGSAAAKISYTTGNSSLPAYKDGEPAVPIQLQLLRIGSLALVGSSGELFNSIGVYMREHSLLEHTLVSNQVRTLNEGAQPLSGYQPDDYALLHDGWHTNNRAYKVGTIDGGYTSLMNRLIESTDR
jgi:hypothetical protein